jgi:UDP-N-acetyl-D-mannosaminuronate dehydrogenase
MNKPLKDGDKNMKKKNKTKVGILGYGEVGQAIAKFYQNPKIKDLKRDDGLKGVEILHICLPWSNNFVKIVKKEIKEIKPKLTIIHSTVAPGTTQKIGGLVVHSPIRGIHPHLYKGIKTFVKYIGTDNKKAGKLAKNHFKSLGIKTKVFQPSITTEIGKLLDTTYYGICIAWHGEMKKICDKAGVDFDKAATDFNQTYNQGYKTLGKPNVVRPVLYPPKGGIGGHCICENAEILQKYFKSQAIDLILKYKPNKKKKV